jgi:putative transcriptional regulator
MESVSVRYAVMEEGSRNRVQCAAVAFASLRGQLLVAAPTLRDPNFQRTVVLVCDHSEEAAMGLVLNRPLEVTVREAVGMLAELVDEDAPVFAGGPVQPDSVLALGDFTDPSEAVELAFESVGFVASTDDPASLADATRRVRVFAGYAGWGPGQLEAELAGETWLVEPALVEDVFADRGDDLWRAVLERKGGQYRLVARMPENPSLN